MKYPCYFLVFILFPGLASAAAPSKTSTVVEFYNLVHPTQPVKQAGSTWAVDGQPTLTVTVDVANGYLALTEKDGTLMGSAALFITKGKRLLLADNQQAAYPPSMKFYELKDGAAIEPKSNPLPALPGSLFLMPTVDKKLIATAPDVLKEIPLLFELPRLGTTIMAIPNLEVLRMGIGMSQHTDTEKGKLYPLLENGFYSRVELRFDAQKGTFTVGKKLSPVAATVPEVKCESPLFKLAAKGKKAVCLKPCSEDADCAKGETCRELGMDLDPKGDYGSMYCFPPQP